MGSAGLPEARQGPLFAVRPGGAVLSSSATTPPHPPCPSPLHPTPPRPQSTLPHALPTATAGGTGSEGAERGGAGALAAAGHAAQAPAPGGLLGGRGGACVRVWVRGGWVGGGCARACVLVCLFWWVGRWGGRGFQRIFLRPIHLYALTHHHHTTSHHTTPTQGLLRGIPGARHRGWVFTDHVLVVSTQHGLKPKPNPLSPRSSPTLRPVARDSWSATPRRAGPSSAAAPPPRSRLCAAGSCWWPTAETRAPTWTRAARCSW